MRFDIRGNQGMFKVEVAGELFMWRPWSETWSYQGEARLVWSHITQTFFVEQVAYWREEC